MGIEDTNAPDLGGRGVRGLGLIRATSYSPTHSRVQYHRG